MAKINVEFDTKDKTLNVVMDGKAVDNVSSVEFYSSFDNDGFNGSVTSVQKMDEEEFVKIMRISAQAGLVEVTETSNLSKLLANKLFPARMV